MEWTTDLGKAWERTGALNNGILLGAIQPTILRHGDGTLQILCRSRQKKIAQSRSTDNGKTWDKLTLSELPNPNSGIDAVTLADGRHLLVYNHTVKGRSPLNVSVSKDGKAWVKHYLVLGGKKPKARVEIKLISYGKPLVKEYELPFEL